MEEQIILIQCWYRHRLKIRKIKKIQSWFRGTIIRRKRLPLILYRIQNYLRKINIELSLVSEDGRINSIIDEYVILEKLKERYLDIIEIAPKRQWYDILVYDKLYGWLPVNIKTSTLTSSDNSGNLAMCLYAYTDMNMELRNSYNNGYASELLIEKLRNKEYNLTKRDYYFLVVNKNNTNDVIINSIKGLSNLTSNINNLPFQICWNNNREYDYKKIEISVNMFIECIKKPKPSWKELFLNNIRDL